MLRLATLQKQWLSFSDSLSEILIWPSEIVAFMCLFMHRGFFFFCREMKGFLSFCIFCLSVFILFKRQLRPLCSAFEENSSNSCPWYAKPGLKRKCYGNWVASSFTGGQTAEGSANGDAWPSWEVHDQRVKQVHPNSSCLRWTLHRCPICPGWFPWWDMLAWSDIRLAEKA